MKYISILIAALVLCLSGCTAVPVKMKFPDAPGTSATVPCPPLQKLTDDPTLSGVSKTITINYTTYYECVVKLNAWQEWYTIQKHIFEGTMK